MSGQILSIRCGIEDVEAKHFPAVLLFIDFSQVFDSIDFFKTTIGVLQGNTLAPYLFSICLDYVLRKTLGSNIELGFTLHIA